MLLFFLQSATLFALAVAAAPSGQSGPYYGLPIGSLHSSNDGTKAEVYAADDKNIMLVNFNHRPDDPGCTVLMAGPPRPGVQEQNVVPSGEGVIIPIRQPLMSRAKRNSPLNSFYNWPFELDNLRAAPVAGAFDSKPRSNPFAGIELDVGSGDSPFEENENAAEQDRSQSPKPRGQQTTSSVKASSDQIIVLDRQGRPVSGEATSAATKEVPRRAPPSRVRVTRPPSPPADDSETEYITTSRLTKDGYVTVKIPAGKRVASRTTTTAAPPTETPLLTPAAESESEEEPEEEVPAAAVPIQAQQAIAPIPRRSRKQRTSAAPPVEDDDSAETTTVAMHILGQPEDKKVPEEKAAEEKKTTEQTPTTRQVELRTARPRNRVTVSATDSPIEYKAVEDKEGAQGLIVGDPRDANFRPPSNVNPRFFGPLPRFPKKENETALPPSKTYTARPTLQEDVSGEEGYTAVFGVEPPATRAPLRRAGPPSAGPPGGDGLVFMLGESASENTVESGDSSTRSPSRGRTFAPQPTRPIAARKSTQASSSIDSQASSELGGDHPLFRVVEDPRAERRRLKALAAAAERGEELPEPTPQAPVQAPPRSGDQFALPSVAGKMLVVSVPNGAKLADYEWFGVYDQCQQTRTAFVSLKDIKPPTEKVIGALVGTSHNVSSSQIQVLNCNTLLIPRFVLAEASNTESYFYVGIGEFPSYIVQQVRAYVVGRPPEEPLRGYNGEDVMVRLPAGWKTFDVNFLSIYSESSRISYGHATIPPVVVPPCDEEN